MLSGEPKRCRCCCREVTTGLVACAMHWFMLPEELRDAIVKGLQASWFEGYDASLKAADQFWQRNGVWLPRGEKT